MYLDVVNPEAVTPEVVLFAVVNLEVVNHAHARSWTHSGP